jgi:hypothetical protein
MTHQEEMSMSTPSGSDNLPYVGRHRAKPIDLPPEPKGFGTDPAGRTKEDWATHAE